MATAEKDHTYAQILHGVVHWVFTHDQLPEWDDAAFDAVDVTNLVPQPQQGWLYDGSTFSEPPIDLDLLWSLVRVQRDHLLSQSDWTQLADVQALMPSEQSAAWVTYRQELRDVTTKYTDPREVIWPVVPNQGG